MGDLSLTIKSGVQHGLFGGAIVNLGNRWHHETFLPGTIDCSLTGAFAVMGLVAVGITLPNSPGMVGQFQWFTMLGVSLSLGSASIEQDAPTYGVILAYAIFVHALSLAWYLVTGLIALATRHVSFAEVWASRKLEGDEPAQ